MEEVAMAEEKDLQVQDTAKQEIETTDAERTRDRLAFVPRVDIVESQEKIELFADMPGVSPDAVDITLEQGQLTINGYVEPEQPEGYTLAYSEYRVGDFVRTFALSNKIDQDGIEAQMKDGVLHLTLPKAGPVQKKIAVKSA
jgi:HSP20 family molecular chaperone IbpA